MSKTYSVTGWRVGYAIAPPQITDAIRKMHDFLTVGAAAPLQQAGITALRLSEGYYHKLRDEYLKRRDRLLGALENAGFKCFKPFGAYYIMTDISAFEFADDIAFTRHLIEKVGVAPVPGSSFYRDRSLGSQQVRFTFCKKEATLDEAVRRLTKLRSSQ
jgi:aminotransferase